jgi:choline O-acetyltransferase
MPSICELPMPRKLRWRLNSRIKIWIDNARKLIDKSIGNLDMYILKYNKFGRDFPKDIKISPDTFIQLSMQLTYYRFVTIFLNQNKNLAHFF